MTLTKAQQIALSYIQPDPFWTPAAGLAGVTVKKITARTLDALVERKLLRREEIDGVQMYQLTDKGRELV